MAIRKIINLFKSRALKQGVIVLIEQGLISLVTFVAGVLMARSSSQEEYAIYMLGWTVLFSIKGIHEALVNLPFTVYSPRLKENMFREYQGSTLIHSILFCLVCALSVFVGGYFYERYVPQSNLRLVELAPLLMFLLSSYVLRDFLRNALLAQLKAIESVRINGVSSLALFLMMVVFYYTGYLNPEHAYIVFASMFSMAALAMFWQYRHNYKINSGLLWPHFKGNWQLAKWALLGNFAFIGARQSYPWLILQFLDYKSVAAYYACLSLAMAPGPILRGTVAYIFPRMSHGYSEGSISNLTRLLYKSILLLCIPYMLWLLVGIIFDDKILSLFYANKFDEYGFLFIMLLVAMTIDFVSAPLTNALQVLEMTRAITVSLIIGACVTLVLGALLTWKYGLYGSGVAAIISMGMTIAWRVIVYWRSMNTLS